MKVLIVLTSHNQLGDTGKQTGFWLEEFAAPYYVLKDAGADITLASPAGGQPPLDPKSDEPDAQTAATERFKDDDEARLNLANTHRLAGIQAQDYDAVFYPGGHGPLWDLYDNADSIRLLEEFVTASKPIAAVCHAPAMLLKVRGGAGDPLVNGKRVTGFANSEEQAVGLTDVVPYLLEDRLKEKGGVYSKGEDWSSYVLVDGKLITGQNPASSEEAARELVKMLGEV